MRLRRIGVLVAGLSIIASLAVTPVHAQAPTATVSATVKIARGWLKSLKTVTPSYLDYSRTADFGKAWVDVDGNGCKTRDDILIRDLSSEVVGSGCQVKSGVLKDPYTGKTINFVRGVRTSLAVQIDHVIPLHLAWQLGAYKWKFGKRVTFANDPVNLIATDGPTNGAKSDSGPDEWLPPSSKYQCTYVIRFIRVAFLYQVGITSSMRTAMNSTLNSCKVIIGKPTLLKALPASVYSYAAAIG
ncbi:MAG: hypothetical protein RIS43_494 [Actinomycetota bacterium]